MIFTSFPVLNGIIMEFVSQIKAILELKLVGVYLFGSLSLGDFNSKVSDIDLFVITSSEIDDKVFNQLKVMHHDFEKNHRNCKNKLEVYYVTLEDLKKLRNEDINIPYYRGSLQKIKADRKSLIDLYLLYHHGINFYGPNIKDIMESISYNEYITGLQKSLENWIIDMRNMSKSSFSYCSYTILTMCRSYYFYKVGKATSKIKAAKWAAPNLPEWSALIEKSLLWRKKKLAISLKMLLEKLKNL